MRFNEKTITTAIFDMDGTMFDTERLRIDMLKIASKDIYGKEMDDDLLFKSLGLSAVSAEKLAKEQYEENYPYKEIRKRADDLEREHIRSNGVPVKNGLYNVLERLKKNGIFIALATSSRREIAEEYLINARVYRYFDILICGDEVKNGKPNPEIFVKAMKEMATEPDNCLIFEDSKNGIIAASESGGLPIFIKDIKDIDLEMKKLVFMEYDSLIDFLYDLIPATKKMPVPTLYEQFPLNADEIVVGIHGFGAIGGGYLAEIFSHFDGYTRPKEIIGATQNPLTINLINSFGKYRIRYESLAYFKTIDSVRMIDIYDIDAMKDMYIKSQLIGLSLPEGVIKMQAKTIAVCLHERFLNTKETLSILVLMNKVNSTKYVKTQISSILKDKYGQDVAKQIMHKTKFIETVVNRMVSQIPEDFIVSKLKNDLYQLHTAITDYPQMLEKMNSLFADYTEKGKKKGSSKINLTNINPSEVFDGIRNFGAFSKYVDDIGVTLFSAEPDIVLYADKGSDIVGLMRQIVIVDDIKAMQKIKNKLSNGTHAIIAWYGKLLGYPTIGQAMGDDRVYVLTKEIMQNEIMPALLNENPNKVKYIHDFIKSFIKRCRSSFKDKCSRVGRDCMRKLQDGERVIGAIRLAHKYGIETGGLEFGAACAIVNCLISNDKNDIEAIKIKKIYSVNNSIIDILTYDGEYNKGLYKGLDKIKDQALIKRIEDKFIILKDEFIK